MIGTAWSVARRNLVHHRARFLASVGGVTLALSLTLALDAIYAGVANQLTTYIDRAGADVWVAQAGVRNLHMVASWLPASVTDEVRAVEGVAEATPVLYSTDTIEVGDERAVVYVIGLPTGARTGGPWNVVEGSGRVDPGAIVVDRGFARRAGATLGDVVTVLGGEARITGLSEGTASLVNSVAFVDFDDFRALRGAAPVVSFVLVGIEAGTAPESVAADIERQVPGVTAMSTAAFGSGEQQLIMDMSADVISIMNGIGFVVALTVVALTVYIATMARRREYGALMALGARSGFLYEVVLGQAFLSVFVGFVAALAFTGLLALVVPATGLDLELAVGAGSMAKVGLFGVIIAALAAVLPIREIAALDPSVVFRRGAAL